MEREREVITCAPSYHDPCKQTDAATAVGVGHHISIANGQEGHRDHPQRLHVVAAQVPVVVVSVGEADVSRCKKMNTVSIR